MRTHVGAQIYWTFRRISHTHTPLSRRVVISRHFLRRPFEFDNLNIFLWAVILVYHNSLMQTLQSRVCIRYLGLKHYRFFFDFMEIQNVFFPLVALFENTILSGFIAYLCLTVIAYLFLSHVMYKLYNDWPTVSTINLTRVGKMSIFFTVSNSVLGVIKQKFQGL